MQRPLKEETNKSTLAIDKLPKNSAIIIRARKKSLKTKKLSTNLFIERIVNAMGIYGLVDFDLHQCFLKTFAATLTFNNVIYTIRMILANLIQKITGVNEEQSAAVISYFKPVEARKNEQLLEYGAVANRLFFINKGCLRLYYSNDDQSIITRFMAFENTFLTSIVSFISRTSSAEYIQAVETSELLVITYEDFSYLRKTIPEWDKMYIHILEYGLTVITSKLGNLLTQSATERYRNLLKNNPELIQRLSNSNLAAYMNISPETLSRLKSQI